MKTSEKLSVVGATGAGLTTAQAAKIIGVNAKEAAVVVETRTKDLAMDLVYESFRRDMTPRIHRLFRRTLNKLSAKIDQASFKELVSLYHELAPGTGVLPGPGGTSETTTTVASRVDLNRPEIITAMREVLSQERTLNAPAVIALPAKEPDGEAEKA